MDSAAVMTRAEAALGMPLSAATLSIVQQLARSIFGELTELERATRQASRSTLEVDQVRARVADLMKRCRELPQLPPPAAMSVLDEAEAELRALVGGLATSSSPASASASSSASSSSAAKGEKRPAVGDAEDDDVEEPADDGEGGRGARGRPAAKASRKGKTPEELASARFEAFPQTWIVKKGTLSRVKGTVAVTYHEHYLKTGEIFCVICEDPKPIKVGSSTGNISQHEQSKAHKQASTAHGAPGGSNPFERAAAGSKKVLTPEQLEAREESQLRLRALLHALMVGTGTNPAQLVKQHHSTGLISQASAALRGTSHAAGSSEATVSRDCSKAEELLDKEVAGLLKGEFYSMGADGTNIRRNKCQIILLNCARIGEPLVVDLVFPADAEGFSDNPVYDFTKAAPDVEKAMAKIGAEKSMCVGFEADNTGCQDALARALNLQRLKCGAHATNLAALGLKRLKLFKPLVKDLSKLIHLGGGFKRSLELEELGLQPREMLVHDGRFGTNVKASEYDRQNVDKIQQWVLTSELNAPPKKKAPAAAVGAGAGAGAGGAAWEEEEENEREMALFDDDDGDSKEVLASKLVERVKLAWNDKMAPVVLELVHIIYEDLNPLITLLSAEGDHVAPDALEKINRLRRHMRIIVEDPVSTLDSALAKHRVKLSLAEHKAWVANVKEVAEVASQKLEKHMVPYTAMLEHRFRYMPRREPEPLPADMSLRKAFLGCLMEDFGPKIVGEYEAYVADITAQRAADAHLPHEARKSLQLNSYEYWDKKKLDWPTLSKVAKWHLNFPTSNISAERGCANLRGIEAMWQRATMAHDTIRREVKFVFNSSVLVRMVERELAYLNTL